MKLMMLAAVASCAWMANTVPVNPLVGIAVRKEGVGYVFLFRNCVDPKKPIDIRRVSVMGNGELRCQLVRKRAEGPMITARWLYGTIPAGYDMAKCSPLQPGETYDVEVSGAAGGSARFIVQKDGTVQMIEDSCK
jgi:hypothetical protein